ncbi:MAG: hypothetical protein DRN20_00400 [Thermoplasmata archaeon]|nr:MAG: hypothetical protein DRN20_00400 [Thermoplasmata archaeon]
MIEAPEIPRIEGHALMRVVLDGNIIDDVHFIIWEGERFFEKLLVAKHISDAPMLASRICGICYIAHGLGAKYAILNALSGEVIMPNAYDMALCIAGILQSHAIHLCVLSLPDALGVESILDMDKKLQHEVMGLRDKTYEIVARLAGRSVHPTLFHGKYLEHVNYGKIGELAADVKKGFERLLDVFIEHSFEWERSGTIACLDRVLNAKKLILSIANSEKKDAARGNEYNARQGTMNGCYEESKYNANNVNIIDAMEYGNAYSMREVYGRKRWRVMERSTLVGPMARVLLCTKSAMKEYGLSLGSTKVWDINIARCVESIHYSGVLIDLIDDLSSKSLEGKRFMHEIDSLISSKDRARPKHDTGEGICLSEAPRGVLVYHFAISDDRISWARIITPTAVNAEDIENTLKANMVGEKYDPNSVKEAMKAIRCYDPCLSCAVHAIRTSIGYK